ncbi:MAG: glycerophosphodiester phosphodiesterase [Promethearchaeota archaeon]
MKNPYIFGHRGAMGYEIENTMKSFERAIETGAGIETDLQLTRDNQIICIHDNVFNVNSKCYNVSKLPLKDIKKIKFEDNRTIPLLEDVFYNFRRKKKVLRYSFDIGDERVGMELIKLAINHDILDNIEITDTRIEVLTILRNYNDKVKLIHTLPYEILVVKPEFISFKKLLALNIYALNLNIEQTIENANLTQIIDNGLKCYVWDVNTELWMIKILNWKYRGHFIESIYTNFPDELMIMRNRIFFQKELLLS